MNLVTVAVCTHNRVTMLPECLESLAAQDETETPREVLIVDDGSTDDTPQLVAEYLKRPGFEHFRYIRQGHAGLSAARNRAIKESQGDPVCFVDDDAETSGSWLRAIIGAVRSHPDMDCFVGRILLRLEGRAPRSCGQEPFAGYLDLGPDEKAVDRIKGGNMFIRRRSFVKVGTFKPGLVWRGDEDDWFARLSAQGGRAMYLPQALIWHRRLAHELHPWALLKTKFGWGIAQVQHKREAQLRFSYAEELKLLLFGALHALRRRCFCGLMSVAIHLGAIWAALTGELKEPRLPIDAPAAGRLGASRS